MSATQHLSAPQFGSQPQGAASPTPPSSAPTSSGGGSASAATVWKSNAAFRSAAAQSAS